MYKVFLITKSYYPDSPADISQTEKSLNDRVANRSTSMNIRKTLIFKQQQKQTKELHEVI